MPTPTFQQILTGEFQLYNRDKIMSVMKDIYEESTNIGPYVVICQPRRNLAETPAQNFDGHGNLHIDLNCISHGFCNIGGEKVDVARNYLFERALESGAKYLFFIGDDTVVPYDAFTILHATAEANPNSVVTGVYYMKASNAMICQRVNGHVIVPDVSPGQLIEAWQTGMDCMLIPMDIVRRLKEEDPELPFCCIHYEPDSGIPFVGEDNFFVHRIRRLGIKLLVNTDVQCLHMDMATGKYTAHPSVDLRKYFTQIPITTPLEVTDKLYLDRRWVDRLPDGTGGITSAIKKFTDLGQPVKFNMGCGHERLEGYIGIDQSGDAADVKQDINTMTLPDECADEIRAVHFIEHLPQHRAPRVLESWFKALKPAGQLVLELPDFEALCRDYLEQTPEERFTTKMCIYGAYVDHISTETELKGTESPHLWGFSPGELEELVKSLGFINITTGPAVSAHPGKNFKLTATKP